MQESPSNYSPFSERHHIRSDLQFHLGTCVKIRPWWVDFVQKSLSNNVLRRKPGTWMGLLSSNPLHRLITFRDPFQQINPSSPTLPHSKVYIGFEVCCFNNTLNALIQFQVLIKCCSNESVKAIIQHLFLQCTEILSVISDTFGLTSSNTKIAINSLSPSDAFMRR